MRAFALTACWAGAFLLPVAWLMPEAHLSPGYPVTLIVVLGGALYGAGACVNGACAFGTLGYLAGGDTNFLGTITGAFTGAIAASLVWTGRQQVHPSPLSEPGALPVLIWLAFVTTVSVACWRRTRRRRRIRMIRSRIWRLDAGLAFVVIGVGGGFLYAVAGKWTYMSILSDRAARLVTSDGSGIEAATLFAALAVFAGAVSAALLGRRFRLAPLRPSSAGPKFLGGAIMGFAAAIIPGGNDVMLVYSLPSAAAHAIVAYAAMTAVLFGFFAIRAGSRPGNRPE